MADRSTIFALSSGRPPAAIAVVRVSGSQARIALERLIDRVPQPRKAALARVHDPASGEAIDEALALWFPAPHSETGEDVAELQLHGGQAVIAGVLKALAAIEDCRLAEPGEFTRRAFENGKLDLTAVEGLGDLIFAETPAQRRQAFRQLKGLIGDRAEAWRRRLIEALALVEARIDFSDEADVPEDLIAPAAEIARALRDEISVALADGHRGERLRDGIMVAILGPPNVGKSSILNRIARRDAAITSAVPGTTRDVVEVAIDLDGYPVILADTAGLRETSDPIEQEGLRRALSRAEEAELRLYVFDATDPAQADGARAWPGPDTILVANKTDLLHRPLRNPSPASGGGQGGGERVEALPEGVTLVSALTGAGIADLLATLGERVAHNFQIEAPVLTRARHREALEDARGALARASGAPLPELRAEDLRLAMRSLGRITGAVDVEDLLDVIFRDFCIGK